MCERAPTKGRLQKNRVVLANAGRRRCFQLHSRPRMRRSARKKLSSLSCWPTSRDDLVLDNARRCINMRLASPGRLYTRQPLAMPRSTPAPRRASARRHCTRQCASWHGRRLRTARDPRVGTRRWTPDYRMMKWPCLSPGHKPTVLKNMRCV